MANIRREAVPSLTTFRGLLAVWVVLYHFWNDVCRMFPSAYAIYPLMEKGLLAVPGFFILSGYILSYNYAYKFHSLNFGDYQRFIVARLARIYPVHLFTLLIVLAMVLVAWRSNIAISWVGYRRTDFVLHLFLVHAWKPLFRPNWNYPSWSISSEWFAYLFFPLICAKVTTKLTNARSSGLFLIACWAGTAFFYTIWNVEYFRDLLAVVPTFLAGCAIHAVLSNRTELDRRWRFAADGLGAAILILPFVFHGKLLMASLLSCFILMILLLGGLRLSCAKWWNWSPLVYVGEVSYSLYMTHTIVQKLVVEKLNADRFVDYSFAFRASILSAYTLMIAALTLFTYYCVENPCRKYLKSATTRRDRPAEVVESAPLVEVQPSVVGSIE